MKTVHLTQHENYFVLELINGDNDNTLNLNVLDEWFQAIDQVQAHIGNTALLIHSQHPKTFSTGIDLPWLMAQTPATQMQFVQQLENLLLRIATLDLPTVAAINGNCYAGGALIASACDYRYMRADKGRFCFPEVTIEKAFTPVMLNIVKLLPNARAQYTLSISADAWGGDVCEQQGIIDQALPMETLYSTALSKTQQLANKHRPTLVAHKQHFRQTVFNLAKQRGLI